MIASRSTYDDLLAPARDALLGGGPDRALRLVEEVIGPYPFHAPALHLQGLAFAELGERTAAARLIERALAIEPNNPGWRRDLGAIHFTLKRYDSAALLASEAVQGSPGDFASHELHGRALLAGGQYDAAIEAFESARRIDASAPEPILGVARAYLSLNRFGDASALCRHVLECDTANLKALRLLAEICFSANSNQDARDILEYVLELAPKDPAALANLVLVCWGLGDLAGTLNYSRDLVDTGRATATLQEFFLYVQLHCTESTPESIREACETFGRSLSPVWRTTWPRTGVNPHPRRLRIGYLSGEFIHGPAFFFLSSLIGNHNPGAVEVFCYHTRQIFDAETDWYRRTCNFRDCSKWDDETIVRQIRSDGIDILVDTSAFYPENRLRIFARRAAPVQATFPNCPTTTGVGNMDYIFTDRWTCPQGFESQYTERPVFLPSGYLMFTPPDAMPEVPPLPALRNGHITFGMFQRRVKTNAAVWDAVTGILHRCPDACLNVQTGAAALDDPESCGYLEMREQFSTRGIAEHRVRLIGKRSQVATLRHMSEVDIALDTFPYQGQTTTCECLWMGVPVVALSGDAHVARVGTALLERVGLGDLAAPTAEAYVQTATRLASDAGALAVMREGMRDRVRRSTLLDGRQLAAEVESAYRSMWNRWIGHKGDDDERTFYL